MANRKETSSQFSSEAAWPFRLRHRQLAEAQAFLSDGEAGPRVLKVFGGSGVGKSFLVRELLVQLDASHKEEVGVYLDVPPGDLEASQILDRLATLLVNDRSSNRDAPTFVGKKAARAWRAASRGASRTKQYGYRAGRDLTGQIPVAGPFVKALLPASSGLSPVEAEPLRFLVKRSASRRTLIVLDNAQFLSESMREALDLEFAEAGAQFRLVVVERIRNAARVDWSPHVPHAEVEVIDLDLATLAEVTELVEEVLPPSDERAEIAATVFRRSEGNLKSVWFQLRFITTRHHDQRTIAASYEDVILSLRPLDQTVLRYVVFTVGGLRVTSLARVVQQSESRTHTGDVATAIADLASLGLLVVNGDSADRVRVEHELVAQVVSEVTPEEEKLELRTQIVAALAAVLDQGADDPDAPVLYDRLIGTVTGIELRQRPSLMAHVVAFVRSQAAASRHRYLAGLCQDTACWDALDILPETTVRALLDAVQKSSRFSFGLVAATRLRQANEGLDALASLYEAKYLVQLFRYDEARRALSRAGELEESRLVEFNILLSLAADDEASDTAAAVLERADRGEGTETDFVILRNAVHLFDPPAALRATDTALRGLRRLGRSFVAATVENNRGIVHLANGDMNSARASLDAAREQLAAFESPEVYQPLVNLCGLAIAERDVSRARQLLAEGQEFVPRSLLQDDAMFDLNRLTIDIVGNSCSVSEAAARARRTLAAARLTQDRRFVDIVNWFSHTLDSIVGIGPSPIEPLAFRKNGLVPLELFISTTLGTTRIDAPFVLSPIWRH